MTTESPLRDRLRARLLEARKARDTEATSALRTALAALENAEAVPIEAMPAAGAVESTALGVGAADAPRRVLTEDEEKEILRAEIRSLSEAAQQYDDLAPERAAAARSAAEVLESCLG